MTINLKTSEANKDRVVELTARLGNNIKENVVARIAIAYSLARGYRLDPAKDLRDSKGKEYKEDTLLGTQYRNLYVALICQHYGIHKTDGNVPRYIKMHLDHGLELMSHVFAENRNYTSIEFLLDYAKSINCRGYISLVELRDGEYQVPVFSPNHVAPLNVKAFEVCKILVFIMLGVRVVSEKRPEIYNLCCTI